MPHITMLRSPFTGSNGDEEKGPPRTAGVSTTSHPAGPVPQHTADVAPPARPQPGAPSSNLGSSAVGFATSSSTQGTDPHRSPQAKPTDAAPSAPYVTTFHLQSGAAAAPVVNSAPVARSETLAPGTTAPPETPSVVRTGTDVQAAQAAEALAAAGVSWKQGGAGGGRAWRNTSTKPAAAAPPRVLPQQHQPPSPVSYAQPPQSPMAAPSAAAPVPEPPAAPTSSVGFPPVGDAFWSRPDLAAVILSAGGTGGPALPSRTLGASWTCMPLRTREQGPWEQGRSSRRLVAARGSHLAASFALRSSPCRPVPLSPCPFAPPPSFPHGQRDRHAAHRAGRRRPR